MSMRPAVEPPRPGAIRQRLFWPGLIGAGYLVASVAVAAVEYLSELSKISRGFFTDTFSPFLYTDILTFPVSELHADWHGYPAVFTEPTFRSTVRHAMGPMMLNIIVETVLLVTVLVLVAGTGRAK
jgi:hypothetical protein